MTDSYSNTINDEAEERKIIIPDGELHLTFVRSSGAGGQKVNKTSSKAELKWNVGESQVFSDEEKARIRLALKTRIDKQDNIILESQKERSQTMNKSNVIERLHRFVSEALVPEKKRVATKPTRSSREKRLGEKRAASEKKKLRGKIDGLE